MQVQATAGAAALAQVPAVQLADAGRREAARRLSAGEHKIGAGACCPCCRGPVLIGATVRIVHAVSCARRAAMTAARAAAGRAARPAAPAASAPALATVPARRPAPAPQTPARPAVPVPAQRSGPGQPADRACPPGPRTARADQELRQAGIRPQVVLRWFVSGCRVRVGGWLATARKVFRGAGGRLKVLVDYCSDGARYEVDLLAWPEFTTAAA